MKKKVKDIRDIMALLPHRYPFLLVDKIIEIDLEAGAIIGQKNVTINEPFFQGHFPNAPIMPGVLILEALAQVGGVLVHEMQPTDKIALLLGVSQAKFRSPVKPGDVLVLKGEVVHVGTKGGRMKMQALVDGKKVTEAELAFALANPKEI